MKIYFRTIIEYDFHRVGYEDYSTTYSLTPFDRNEHIARGYAEYSEVELPDFYTEEEALALAEKILNSNQSRDKTIQQDISEKQINHIKKTNPELSEMICNNFYKLPLKILHYLSKIEKFILNEANKDIKEGVWKECITFYPPEKLSQAIKVCALNDHIELKAKNLINHKNELEGYAFSDSNSLILTPDKNIPFDVIRKLIIEILQ